jgi:hypothetical protein
VPDRTFLCVTNLDTEPGLYISGSITRLTPCDSSFWVSARPHFVLSLQVATVDEEIKLIEKKVKLTRLEKELKDLEAK